MDTFVFCFIKPDVFFYFKCEPDIWWDNAQYHGADPYYEWPWSADILHSTEILHDTPDLRDITAITLQMFQISV